MNEMNEQNIDQPSPEDLGVRVAVDAALETAERADTGIEQKIMVEHGGQSARGGGVLYTTATDKEGNYVSKYNSWGVGGDKDTGYSGGYVRQKPNGGTTTFHARVNNGPTEGITVVRTDANDNIISRHERLFGSHPKTAEKIVKAGALAVKNSAE